MIKVVLNCIGLVAVALGVIGIFLPLVPTTPFLLLASACFLRGSDRLHRWLLNNRWCGKFIRDFEEKRAVPLRAKVTAIALMWISMAFSMTIVPTWWHKAMLLVIAVCVTAYLVRLRTLKEE
ncbi:MAG TPA: YbaN family protein [Noviherbaspirillum sp.]|nr:YbaN family protein [Noviherbaspirillum sp.]